MLAVVHNLSSIVEALIEADAKLNAKNQRGETSLIMAVRRGNTAIARILVDAGADTDIMDNDGLLAFDHAMIRKDNEMAAILEHSNQRYLRVILEFEGGKTKTFFLPSDELDQSLDLRKLVDVKVVRPKQED